jgi:hypothetical protein
MFKSMFRTSTCAIVLQQQHNTTWYSDTVLYLHLHAYFRTHKHKQHAYLTALEQFQPILRFAGTMLSHVESMFFVSTISLRSLQSHGLLEGFKNTIYFGIVTPGLWYVGVVWSHVALFGSLRPVYPCDSVVLCRIVNWLWVAACAASDSLWNLPRLYIHYISLISGIQHVGQSIQQACST